MGCISSSTTDAGAKHDNPIPSKQARIVVVGGGPAGIHFAAQLVRKGYTNVTILERDAHVPNVYGKTHTHFEAETGDVNHEMGTCYLSASYNTIRALVHEYLGEDQLIDPGGPIYNKLVLPAPRLEREKRDVITTSDEWLFAEREKVAMPKLLWNLVPDKLQTIGFLFDVNKYRNLHEEILGVYDYHGLPPRPGPAAMRRLNCTFRELMRSNGLETLLELCCIGFGSYGFNYDVPALYGLWFVDPPAVEAYIGNKLFPDKIKTVQLMKYGFASLWKAIVEKENLKIRYESKIEWIDRNLKDPRAPVRVKLAGAAEPEEYDFLVFAAPMNESFLPIVKDPTPLEREIVSHLHPVGLCVTLFKTEKKMVYPTDSGTTLEEQALTFYPESLQMQYTPKPSGEVYAERNSVRAYRWEREPQQSHRYDVAYQYFPEPQSDDAEVTKRAVAFITDPVKCVNPTPGTPEKLFQKNWQNYFPHFDGKAVQKHLPWRVMDSQGLNKTFYIGSSVCFESVEDVTKYNLQVIRNNSV